MGDPPAIDPPRRPEISQSLHFRLKAKRRIVLEADAAGERRQSVCIGAPFTSLLHIIFDSPSYRTYHSFFFKLCVLTTLENVGLLYPSRTSPADCTQPSTHQTSQSFLVAWSLYCMSLFEATRNQPSLSSYIRTGSFTAQSRL